MTSLSANQTQICRHIHARTHTQVDRDSARLNGEVEDELFELFVQLQANDSQMDFPILYASAKNGWCVRDLSGDAKKDITSLYTTIVENVPAPTVADSGLFSVRACARVLVHAHELPAASPHYGARDPQRWRDLGVSCRPCAVVSLLSLYPIFSLIPSGFARCAAVPPNSPPSVAAAAGVLMSCDVFLQNRCWSRPSSTTTMWAAW